MNSIEEMKEAENEAFEDLLNIVADVQPMVAEVESALSCAATVEKLEDLSVNVAEALEAAQALVSKLKALKKGCHNATVDLGKRLALEAKQS